MKTKQHWTRIFLLSTLLSAISAQAQFQWSGRIASADNMPEGEFNAGLALDTNANCYVTGWFDGTNDFGGVTLTNQSNGGSDIFLAKYNSAGALQWVQQAGGNAGNINYGRAVGADTNGNIYVTGGYHGPANFGGANLPATAGEQFFLAKYNAASSAVQWVQTNSSDSSDVYGIGLTVDNTGNSYVLAVMDWSGTFATFGSKTVATANYGTTFLILVKYDSTGTAQWAKLFDSSTETYGSKVAVDAAGNVYVHGTFNSDMEIGTSNLVGNAGSQNMFVAKFDNLGNLVWVQSPQSPGQNGSGGEGGVAVDGAGNVYVSGAYQTSLNFGGGISLTNSGLFDAFLAKFNSSGTALWAQSAGSGTNSIDGYAGFYADLALDAQTNIYAAGFLSGAAVVAKYTPTGSNQWSYLANSPPANPFGSMAVKCAVDSAGHCYLSGLYQGTTAFGTNALQPQETWNFFLAETVTNPTVEFTASPTSGFTPLTVQFNSPNVDNQGNSITSWNWNFGDGSTTNTQNPLHIYTNSGTFNPILLATNNYNVVAFGYGSQITVVEPTPSSCFTYSTSGGTITITGYTCTNTVVLIPSTINGFPVTSIGVGAFAFCHLASVTIPNSVTSIGDYAFYSCSLTSVTIPDSVTNIGDYAFTACYRLASVTIGNSVTSVGNYAFDNCPDLAAVTIGNSVTSIGEYAFSYCSDLTSVTLPNSLTSIGTNAFYYSDLTSMTIGSSVTNIGNAAFDCYGLTNIAVSAGNPSYASVGGVLFNNSMTTLIQYPGDLPGSYAIPNTVTCIGDYAFDWSGRLTTVTIPESVTNIGDYAFNYCQGLTSITIPNSDISIGDYAFEGCFSLTSITIPDSVASIGYGAFENCFNLMNVTIGNSVTNIGGEAFSGCNNLTSIFVSANNPSYSSVAGVLFNDNQTVIIAFPCGLTGSYTIPNSVTNIGDYAFYNCSGLTNITIGNSVMSIGDYAFWECFLNNVTIPNSVISIGNYAFYNCGSLTSVTIPNSVTNIGEYAFSNCSGLHKAYFQGNAPNVGFVAGSADSTIFSGESGTAYYLLGTSGWGSTFGGWPTALWYQPKPMILGSGSGFGVQSNRFGFTISWATNLSVVVQACTNLANPVWTPVATNALVNGTNYFSDPNWTNYPSRFYRITAP